MEEDICRRVLLTCLPVLKHIGPSKQKVPLARSGRQISRFLCFVSGKPGVGAWELSRFLGSLFVGPLLLGFRLVLLFVGGPWLVDLRPEVILEPLGWF